MSSSIDVIKEYLVSIGFGVNSNQLNQAKNAMKQASAMVSGFAGNSVTQFAVASAGVVAFVASATIGLAKFIGGLAQADLQNEMFARKMWTSKENAIAFKNSLDALGATMEDLYFSPELMQKFQILRNQSFQMAPPPEYASMMKGVRSIIFEFQRLKLEATYAMQWIGFYLMKYLAEPMAKFKQGFKNLNDLIQKNMPKWTKEIAQVLSWFVRLGETLWKVKEGVAMVVGAFGAMKMISLLTSPIGMMIAGLVLLLLVMEDYVSFTEGKKSLFGKFWQSLKDSGVSDALKSFSDAFSDLWDAIKNVSVALGDLILKITGNKSFKEFADMLANDIRDVLKGIEGYVRGITDLLNGDFKKAMGNFQGGNEKLFQPDRMLNVDKQPSSGNAYLDFMLKGTPTLMTGNVMGYAKLMQNMIAPSYAQPQVPSSVKNDNTQQNTFNIYGTDPKATANAVSGKLDYGMMTRIFGGATK